MKGLRQTHLLMKKTENMQIRLALWTALMIPSVVFAQPMLSVTDNGVNANSNREWLISIAPDPALFTSTANGTGSSMATELAFEVTGSTFLSASTNSSDWPFDNPGNDPFTSGVSFGTIVNSTTVFAALGSEFLTVPQAYETLVIETQGTGETTVSWGGHTLLPGTSNTYVGSRIAQSGTNFDEYQGSLTLGGSGAACDFNQDGLCDCLDVDSLTTEIANGTNNTSFDLNSDGFVNGADLTAWLTEGGEFNLGAGSSYLRGDANLDGVVDASDFNIWNGNKFTIQTGWCNGDFNANGFVDISDFNIWNANKFTSSRPAAVPEPTASGLLLTAFSLLIARARIHNRRSR